MPQPGGRGKRRSRKLFWLAGEKYKCAQCEVHRKQKEGSSKQDVHYPGKNANGRGFDRDDAKRGRKKKADNAEKNSNTKSYGEQLFANLLQGKRR